MPKHSASRSLFNVLLCLFSILLLNASSPAWADQSILLRSGNGTVGKQDAQVRFVRYAVSQDTPPGPSDFAAAQTGTFAYIDAPYPTYMTPAQFSDPLAQWIGTTPALGGGSALYAIPFKVTDPVIAAATLNLGYSVDNAVHGVYINGTEISNFVNDGDYHGEYYVMRSDIASLLIRNATNWLYIKTYDYSTGYAGLMFSATITTQGTAPGAPTITPKKGGNAGPVSFRIIGSGFEAGTSLGATPDHANPAVTLTGTGSIITATNVSVVSPNVLTGTFDLTGATPGIRTVTVTNWDGTSLNMSNAFTILQGGTATFSLSKIGSSAVASYDEDFFITMTNNGLVDSGAVPVTELLEPWFTFVSSGPQPTSSTTSQNPLTLNPYVSSLEWDLRGIPTGSSIVIPYDVKLVSGFPAGNTVHGPACIKNFPACKTRFDQCMAVLAAPPSNCVAGSINQTFGCWIGIGVCYTSWVTCNTDASIDTGAVKDCAIAAVKSISAHDPNDLTGPSGFSTPQWIQQPVQMSYALSFNNLANATKAATNVAINNTFDVSTLDLTTLAVNAITIGSTSYTLPGIPLAALPFSQDIDLRPAQNLIVRVSGSLNQTTNQANVNFLSLDPTTGLPPTDPTIGFLAPDTGGVVLFNITPKPVLTTGTAIPSSGSVVFDTNPPLATNTWSNSIDITPPVSQVATLPATITTPNFMVNWGGTDVGSGIEEYTVYVSDNGGAYTAWQTDSTLSSATYSGTIGHTYSFYSIARDNVGNVEGAKSAADASVKILGSTTTTLSASATTAAPGQNITLITSVAGRAGTTIVPTGNVTFYAGTTAVGSQALNVSGVATLNTTLPAGVNSVTAQYAGDGMFAGSASSAVLITVTTPSFTVSYSPTTLTVSRGQPAQTTITVTPAGGFNSTVSFSCSRLPSYSTCSFSPATLTPTGNNSVTSTLTVTVDVTGASLRQSNSPFHASHRQELFFASLLLPMLSLLLLRRRLGKSAWSTFLTAAILLFGPATLMGCGQGSSNPAPLTPSGTYTVLLNVTGGSITTSGQFSLIVR